MREFDTPESTNATTPTLTAVDRGDDAIRLRCSGPNP
jgi:hypothetical protein